MQLDNKWYYAVFLAANKAEPDWYILINIYNSNRTEQSPILSVIIRAIAKIEKPQSGSPIYHQYYFDNSLTYLYNSERWVQPITYSKLNLIFVKYICVPLRAGERATGGNPGGYKSFTRKNQVNSGNLTWLHFLNESMFPNIKSSGVSWQGFHTNRIDLR